MFLSFSGCSSSDGVDNGVCNAICATTDWLCGSLKTDDQLESCKIQCAHDIETERLDYNKARSMKICIENASYVGSCMLGQECITDYPTALVPPPSQNESEDATDASESESEDSSDSVSTEDV